MVAHEKSRRGPRLGAAAMLALAAMAIASPRAQAQFGAPVDVSAPGADVGAPVMAIDHHDGALVAWVGADGAVTVASRPAGGLFSGPVEISPSGKDITHPQVAVDAAGDALVVWTRDDAGSALPRGVVQAAYRPAGGSFGTAVDLSVDDGGDATVPQVAFDAVGDALVVWQRHTWSDYRTVVQAAYRPAGGSFDATTDVSGPDAEDPQVVFDAAGNATVVWASHPGAFATSQVESVGKPHGGSFGNVTAVSIAGPDTSVYTPQITLNPAADTLVTWIQSTFNGPEVLEYAWRPAGGAYGTPAIMSNRDAFSYQTVFDTTGTAVTVFDGGAFQVFSTVRPAGGSFSPETELAPFDGSEEADESDLTVDSAGNVFATWSNFDFSTGYEVQGSLRTPGGSFGAGVTLSPAGQDAEFAKVAYDSTGNALVVWQHKISDSVRTVQAAYGRPQASAPHSDQPIPTPTATPAATTAPTPVPAPVDRTPPKLTVSAAAKQKAAVAVKLTVTCPAETCALRVVGSLRTPKIGSVKAKTFMLKSLSRQLAKAKKTPVTMKLGSAATTAVRRALHAHKPVTVKLTVSATDAAGNRTSRSAQVRLVS